MELNGALLNRSAKYQELGLLVKTLLSHRSKPMLRAPSPRAGEVKAAVVRALELSIEPMRLKDVHRACEELLDREVSYTTVKDCVHKHSRGERATFTRVAHGRYEAKERGDENLPAAPLSAPTNDIGVA